VNKPSTADERKMNADEPRCLLALAEFVAAPPEVRPHQVLTTLNRNEQQIGAEQQLSPCMRKQASGSSAFICVICGRLVCFTGFHVMGSD